MKKKISFLFMIALLAYSLIMPCVADEPELVTDITTELVTEMLEETTPEATDPEAPAVDTEDAWEEFKAKITDSATWTMIGTGLVTILTILGTVKSKFDKISSLIHNKADNDTIKGDLADLQKELKKAYNDNYKEVSAVMKRYEDALKTTAENEQKISIDELASLVAAKVIEALKTEEKAERFFMDLSVFN